MVDGCGNLSWGHDGTVGVFVIFCERRFLKFFSSVKFWSDWLIVLFERVTTGVCWDMSWYRMGNEGKNYLGIWNVGLLSASGLEFYISFLGSFSG